jgi:hypothetical protein
LFLVFGFFRVLCCFELLGGGGWAFIVTFPNYLLFQKQIVQDFYLFNIYISFASFYT